MSNCLLWALSMYWRRRGRKRYVVLRRSLWGPFPHVLYAEARPGGLRLIGYIPKQPVKRLIPPPLFAGRVHWGDL